MIKAPSETRTIQDFIDSAISAWSANGINNNYDRAVFFELLAEHLGYTDDPSDRRLDVIGARSPDAEDDSPLPFDAEDVALADRECLRIENENLIDSTEILEAKIAGLTALSQRLEDELARLNIALSAKTAKVAELEAESDTDCKEITRLREAFAALSSDHGQYVRGFEAGKREAQTPCPEEWKVRPLLAAHAKIDDLERELTAAESVADQQRERAKRAEAALSQMADNLKAANERVADADLKIESLKRVARRAQRLEGIEAHMDTLRKSHAREVENLHRLQRDRIGRLIRNWDAQVDGMHSDQRALVEMVNIAMTAGLAECERLRAELRAECRVAEDLVAGYDRGIKIEAAAKEKALAEAAHLRAKLASAEDLAGLELISGAIWSTSARENERLVRLALAVGLEECERLRAEVARIAVERMHWTRADEREACARAIEAAPWPAPAFCEVAAAIVRARGGT